MTHDAVPAGRQVVIIEDDRDIAELIEHHLKDAKFHPTICSQGAEGMAKVRRLIPKLIVLDLMLPDMSGLDICRLLKSDPRTNEVPILMLTAKGEEIDRIVGFEVGADDYLTKPFSPRELILRAKAILKRGRSDGGSSKKSVQFGELFVDSEKFLVLVAGAEIKLTAIEFKLLEYLLGMKSRVATRSQLLDQVWGYDAEVTTRTVDTHVKRLRQKLGKAGAYLETIRSVGYRWRERP